MPAAEVATYSRIGKTRPDIRHRAAGGVRRAVQGSSRQELDPDLGPFFQRDDQVGSLGNDAARPGIARREDRDVCAGGGIGQRVASGRRLRHWRAFGSDRGPRNGIADPVHDRHVPLVRREVDRDANASGAAGGLEARRAHLVRGAGHVLPRLHPVAAAREAGDEEGKLVADVHSLAHPHHAGLRLRDLEDPHVQRAGTDPIRERPIGGRRPRAGSPGRCRRAPVSPSCRSRPGRRRPS